jgi:hypothetical protein
MKKPLRSFFLVLRILLGCILFWVVSSKTGGFKLALPVLTSPMTVLPVLVFSFVGYTSQEITVGTRTSVDVDLAADVTTLQEIVVTGYSGEKKADLIGAVAVVDMAQWLRETPHGCGPAIRCRRFRWSIRTERRCQKATSQDNPRS